MAAIGICHKRKCEIIRTAIEYNNFDPQSLNRILDYTIEEIIIAIDFYTNSQYVVYSSLSIPDRFFIYNKKTGHENEFIINEAKFAKAKYHIDQQTAKALQSFGFKREEFT